MNALLVISMDWFPQLIDRIREKVSGSLLVTNNFEEISALVKAREICRLCIIIGGYNYSKAPWNTIEGHEAVEELHKINPILPIMVVNGEKSEISKATGLQEKISKDTAYEVYINCNDCREDYESGKIFQDFYN